MARKTKTKVGKKKPDTTIVPEGRKPTGKPPKRIKMLVSLANQTAAYTMGCFYDVPKDVPVNTARGWIGNGAAEKVE